jgi:PAS domain S-box-containing protein
MSSRSIEMQDSQPLREAHALTTAGTGLVEVTMNQAKARTGHSNIDEVSNAIEQRLRLIIDTIPTIVWRKLPDGSADFLNKHFREYTGLSLEEGMGWGWMNAFHPDDRLKEEWRAALAAEKPFEKEARLRRADGQYRWFLIRAVPLRDEQGSIVKWYGATSDIDELKGAEDRIGLMINTMPTMVWTLQPDGAIDFVNQRWMDYTGLSLEKEMEDPTRPVHPEDLPRVMKKWLADIAAGEASEDEMRLRRADGEYRWFLVRTAPLRDEQGNVVKWFGISIDIEDRKQAEEALRSTESEQRHIAAQLERERARLVEAQEMAKIGSWETELASLSVIWSEQTHRIFETDPSRFHPTRPKFREFIHPEDRAKVDGAFAASLDNRSPCTVEYRIVMPDGRVKILEERWQAFHDGEGKPIRVAGTCRDITERVRAEEELRRLSGQLLRLQDEERRRIARDLHDSTGQDLVALATTLSQIRASIPSSGRKLRKLASQCQALADQCIRDVRTLSYLLHPPMLDEAGLEDAIRHYASGFTERTGIELELEISPRLGRMKPHVELALFRVVQESLTNIQRHSGSPKAKIRIEHGPGKFTLEISDKGSGISGSLRRRNGKMPFGLGVGIPSMHERVALIGGQLDIESSSGGTMVRVTIPVDD